MDFSLTEDQNLIMAMCQELCRKEIEPRAEDLDEEGRIPDDLLEKYADLGLFGMTIPKKYGGTEAGDFAHLLAMSNWLMPGHPPGGRSHLIIVFLRPSIASEPLSKKKSASKVILTARNYTAFSSPNLIRARILMPCLPHPDRMVIIIL